MFDRGWPFGEYPPGGLDALGPHVTAYYGSSFPVSNSAIVRGADATLVFDANIIGFARELRMAVETRPYPPLRDLVLSHVHDDHTYGAMHFVPPARAIARAYTRDKLAEWAAEDPAALTKELRREYPDAAPEDSEVRVVVPDVVVEEEQTLDLGGGVRVHLRPEGPAHTRADLWALVEPDGVALCGDLWFNECEPYLASGSIEGALSAVSRLRDADAGIYVPGHGRAGMLARRRGEDPVERFGTWLLEEIGAGVRRGLSGEELKAAVRRRYEEEPMQPEGTRFRVSIPGFLEDAVESEASRGAGG